VTVSLICDSPPARDAVGCLGEEGRLTLRPAYKLLTKYRSTASERPKRGSKDIFPACQVPGAMRLGGQSSTVHPGCAEPRTGAAGVMPMQMFTGVANEGYHDADPMRLVLDSSVYRADLSFAGPAFSVCAALTHPTSISISQSTARNLSRRSEGAAR
jgi:hypothetical protein